MGRGSLFASIILVLAVVGGVVFWLSRERRDEKAPIGSPQANAGSVPERGPTKADDTPKPVPPAAPDDVAFTYEVDGRPMSMSRKDADDLMKRIQLYNDLDFEDQQGDYDLYEFVFGEYEARDACIRITDAEIKADYARLFDTPDFESGLKNFLAVNQVSREEFDALVRGRVAARKLREILRETGVSSDKQTQEELQGFCREFLMAFIEFPGDRSEFKDIPPEEADTKAFDKCHVEAGKIKTEMVALNDELCKAEVAAINQRETEAAEKEILEKQATSPAAAKEIRKQHQDAAQSAVSDYKARMGGRAFDQVAEKRNLRVETTKWFRLPSPVDPPTSGEPLNFFQRYTLPTRLLKGQFGGVYDDRPNLKCLLAKKIDERDGALSLSAADVLKGRRRWSNRLGFQRELTLRYPALMRKYKCVPHEVGVIVPMPGGGKAPGVRQKTGVQLPPGVPKDGEIEKGSPLPPRSGTEPGGDKNGKKEKGQ